MPMSQHRRAVAAILVALFALAAVISAPLSALAQTSPSNPIVQVALKYVGTQGGQCWVFVQNVVKEATGIQMGFDYRQGFLHPISGPGATEVSVANAQPGDIIQIDNDADTGPNASYTGLHTSIIVKNNGDGSFLVVDSNFNFDEMVTEHDNYNPAAAAARYGLQFHIYRFPTNGQSGSPAVTLSAASPPSFAAGDKAITNTPGDVLNVRSSASVSAAIVTRLPDGSTVTVTGPEVAADGYHWVPISTATGATGWVASEYLRKGTTATSSGSVAPVLPYHAVVGMVSDGGG